jgi:hypothetical protein
MDFVPHFQAHITQLVGIQVCLAPSAIFRLLMCLIPHLVRWLEEAEVDYVWDQCGTKSRNKNVQTPERNY